MTELEVRAKMKDLKGDLLLLEFDEKTGKAGHAEVHRDSRLIWKFPKKSRTRIKPQKWSRYGYEWRGFSLARKEDGYALEQMGRYLEA